LVDILAVRHYLLRLEKILSKKSGIKQLNASFPNLNPLPSAYIGAVFSMASMMIQYRCTVYVNN
jgi:hypothetical protein